MKKSIIIAEKPDQAKSFYLPLLEKLSGEEFTQKNGYFESNSYYITWFFGHLLEQLMPDEYENGKYKEWKIEHLPIIPKKMIYRFKGSGQQKQGQLIMSLCQESHEIICGTDPDREGQGIFDTFINFYQIRKPMKRLWATSLTEKDLEKAWGKMKKIEEYKGLSLARELRADSDWLVGMNGTRAYSIVSKAYLPIGRVVTATLALIVKRDFEVENYKESFFYQLKGSWNGIGFTYFDESGTKFEKKEILDRVKTEIETKSFCLSKFEAENKVENPPKPFNLPDLQKEANKKFGFSLDKTLELAQKLYEKKVTTYPRTDSPYLPESDLQEYHQLVRRAASGDEAKLLRPVGEKPACVKNTESPHTALIITGENSSMNEDESKLYELIRSRFVCAFMQPRAYIQYDIEIDEGTGKKFKATIRQDVDSGFRKHYKEEEKEEGVEEAPFKIDELALKQRQNKIDKLSVLQLKKAKPKYYTPATLITAMQTCGRSLENEEARKILSETKGIGTPATQAIYPKNLQKSEYITEKSGSYISTNKGRRLIAEISPDLKTPELTADWEMKLQLIEQGRLSGDEYRKKLYQYVYGIVEGAIQRTGKINLNAGEITNLICPNCKSQIFKTKWGYACDKKNGCGFRIGYNYSGKTLTDNQIEILLTKGETPIIKGFVSNKNGSKYDSKLVLIEEGGKNRVGHKYN